MACGIAVDKMVNHPHIENPSTRSSRTRSERRDSPMEFPAESNRGRPKTKKSEDSNDGYDGEPRSWIFQVC